MATDNLGLEFSASRPETAAGFEAAMDDYMVFTGEPMHRLKGAAEADPDFALGYCLMGCLRLFAGVSGSNPQVEGELALSRDRREAANPRERAHIDAFETAAAGEMSKAGQMWDAILADHPHDMMAVKCAHEAYFLVGESANLRDSVAAVLPAWDESLPYYGFLLGMGAFGHEETGDYETAEEMGRRAVEIEPDDCWAVHAVAHVLHMQGRRRDGIGWLDGTVRHWRDKMWLKGHLWWHLTLQLIEDGQIDRVLQIFDDYISDCDEDQVTRLMDCSSLLLRLELAGVEVGERWHQVVPKWLKHMDEHAIGFTDAHLALTLARAGEDDRLAEFFQSLDAYIEAQDNTNQGILAHTGRDLCHGMAAFARGDYATAADRIHPIHDDIWNIGGSNAQRQMFTLTLIKALLRSGRFTEARQIVEPWATEVPAPTLWRDLAEALEGTGHADGAVAARRHAAELVNW